jgi:hypothetical protein
VAFSFLSCTYFAALLLFPPLSSLCFLPLSSLLSMQLACFRCPQTCSTANAEVRTLERRKSAQQSIKQEVAFLSRCFHADSTKERKTDQGSDTFHNREREKRRGLYERNEGRALCKGVTTRNNRWGEWREEGEEICISEGEGGRGH